MRSTDYGSGLAGPSCVVPEVGQVPSTVPSPVAGPAGLPDSTGRVPHREGFRPCGMRARGCAHPRLLLGLRGEQSTEVLDDDPLDLQRLNRGRHAPSNYLRKTSRSSGNPARCRAGRRRFYVGSREGPWRLPQSHAGQAGAVLDAARRLGHTPNEIARSLITGRSSSMGLVIGDIENPFFATRAQLHPDSPRDGVRPPRSEHR